ncbi:MAG: hypothetical protein KAX28_11725 [Candidatus Marinimicrobia bacterium]|nr:hypothetical protein [Candidatus Neomarinimicrobiota bacterium]
MNNWSPIPTTAFSCFAEGEASTFQWQDMLKNDLMLMSLKTHRYLYADPNAGSLCSADSPGTRPDRKDGSRFVWTKAGE